MPFAGFIGGLMIGTAAALLLLGLGRIAGVSGLAARAAGLAGATPWPIATAFVAGLPLGAALVAAVAGSVTATFPSSTFVLMGAGLLVGVGTRFGAGCTSGHGVCGLSRLSPRSIAATVVFMGAGFATVYAMRVAGYAP
jgi:uncharacterized membrane protein YedE/YeeE